VTETLVLIVGNSHVDLWELASAVPPSCKATVSEHVLSIVCGADACYLVQILDPEADGVFDDWSSAALPSEPRAIFSIDYRSPDLVTEIVHSFASRWPIVVDTNFGDVVAGLALDKDLLTGR
jgi:hypothetical protein